VWAGVLAAFVAAAAMAAPKLTLPEESFDFGFVPQHAKVSHVFWLKSTGDDSLKILKVIPGCGCTKAPLDKQEMAAGDSTQLEVIFSTGNYTRKVTKRPKIQTNEGPPDRFVSILCNVETHPDSSYPLVIDPYKLDMTQLGDKVRDEMSFTIKNVTDQKLALSVVSLPANFFRLEIPASVAPGATVEGKLKLDKSAIDQDFEKSFTLELSDAGHTRFTVPVKRVVRPSGDNGVAASEDNDQ
jgi:hypothetical protein